MLFPFQLLSISSWSPLSYSYCHYVNLGVIIPLIDYYSSFLSPPPQSYTFYTYPPLMPKMTTAIPVSYYSNLQVGTTFYCNCNAYS